MKGYRNEPFEDIFQFLRDEYSLWLIVLFFFNHQPI